MSIRLSEYQRDEQANAAPDKEGKEKQQESIEQERQTAVRDPEVIPKFLADARGILSVIGCAVGAIVEIIEENDQGDKYEDIHISFLPKGASR